MKPNAKTLTLMLGFLLSILWLSSCGELELLNQLNDTYQISIVLTGGEGDAPNDLEVFQLADP